MNKDDIKNESNPETELDNDRKDSDLDASTATDNDNTAAIPTPPPRFDNNVTPVEEREPSDRSYLVAVLLAIFVPYGITRIYTGHKDGLIRVIWFIASIVLLIGSVFVSAMSGFGGGSAMLLSLSMIIFGISLIVLSIWNFVDLIMSLSRKTDVNGREMLSTERDVKWAKTIYWTVVGLIILYVLFGFVSFASLMSGIDSMQLNPGSPLTI